MMRDVMQNAGLVGFAEIGLILFFVAFALVIIRTMALTTDEECEEALNIPLDEGSPVTPDAR